MRAYGISRLVAESYWRFAAVTTDGEAHIPSTKTFSTKSSPLGKRGPQCNSTVWHEVIGEKRAPMNPAQVRAYLRDGTLEESNLISRPGGTP
jgi:hypothetical protein